MTTDPIKQLLADFVATHGKQPATTTPNVTSAPRPLKAPTMNTDAAPAPVDTDAALWLHSPAAAVRDAVTLGQGLPTHVLGQPVKHAWADALLCGSYTHPATGQAFTIDRNRLDGMVSSFKRMNANGVRVPIVEDHKELAASSLGWVIDAKRDGDRLMLLHQFIGDDAALKASRNHVSLKINGKFADGKGNVYGDAFTHSALTPVPVIPNQQGFIAASRGQHDEPVNVYVLAAKSPTGGRRMTAEQLQKCRELPGAADNITEETAFDWLLSYASTAADNCSLLLSRATDAENALEGEKGKVMELSRQTGPAAPDDYTLSLLSRALKSERDAVINKGWTPAVVDAIESLFTDKGTPNVLGLSRVAGSTDPLVFNLFGILAKNRPGPESGTVTGVQTLSRTVPDDATAPADDIANNPLLKRRDELIKEMRGGK